MSKYGAMPCCGLCWTPSCAESRRCAAQVIKLSDAIQPLPRSVTQFVHGVAKPFLATGELMAASRGTPLPGAAGSPPKQPPPSAANGVDPGALEAL